MLLIVKVKMYIIYEEAKENAVKKLPIGRSAKLSSPVIKILRRIL